MKTCSRHHVAWLACAGLLLTACDGPEVDFGHPFPTAAPDLTAFPARHQGRYVAPDDSTRQLYIAEKAMWSAQLWSTQLARHQLDSAKIPPEGRKLNIWQMATDKRYRLRAASADSVWLDTWSQDTLCDLGAASASRLRWWRGAYYLSQPADDAATYWNVERFVLDGRRLSREALSDDTLRIAVLPPGVVRRLTAGKNPHYLLNPSTRKQERQIANYDGLWTLHREYVKQ